MNMHSFPNLGTYLTDFFTNLQRQAASKGRTTFSVQVLDGGLADADMQLLR